MAWYTVFSDFLTILLNVFVFLYCVVKNFFVQTIYGGEEGVFHYSALYSSGGNEFSYSSVFIGFFAILNIVFSDKPSKK